ncbi:MAG: hypothetical protein WBQ26_08545 [Gemmatimonadaceae bacterium]|nr:hypothetical protein [Gemmatimonadaceae bacterium]
MSGIKTMAAVVLVAGVFALTYGGFTYTRSTHHAQFGPFAMMMQDRQTVAIPIWAGIAAVLVGGVLLLIPTRAT